jgi:hypothetical protein
MRLHLSTLLDCPAEKIWQEVRGPRAFQYVCAPLLTFRPVQPPTLPEQWAQESYLVRMYLLGVLPLGSQWIRVSYPPADLTPGRRRFQLHDDGSGGLCKKWDHWITIEEIPGGRTRYSDRIDIEAGWLTPLVWLAGCLLFRWRQRRCRRLVRRGFDYRR